MHKMTDAEAWAFLADRQLARRCSPAPRTTVVHTRSRRGTWLDGDELVFTDLARLGQGRQHPSRPARDRGRPGPRPPYDYVSVDGEATLLDDDRRVSSDLDRARCQVHGRRPRRGVRARNGVPGELVVRVRPTHIHGYTEVAG